MLIGLLIILLVAIAGGLPILLAIGIVGFVGLLLAGLNPALYPMKVLAPLDSFSLLAMPYFIIAGELMSRGGIGRRLVEFAETLVGGTRAGLGQSSILANMIFGNVSGSATAGTSAIGSILIPNMTARNYDPGLAASITACGGVIGSIIPPSMIMIVYGSMAGVSVGDLFLAGIIPGLLITVALMAMLYLHSFLPRHAALRQVAGGFQFGRALRAVPRVWVALLAPVIVLGGILGGIFTATEAAVVACVYSLIVSLFIYRSVTWRELPAILLRGAVTNAVVVGVIAVAGALGWLLSILDFSATVSQVIFAISTVPMVVLLVLMALMLLLTMFIESLAVLIILVPVIVEIGARCDFHPLHLGMVVIMATQIGSTTPPVAVQLFVATGIARCPYDQTVRRCWPFVGTLIIVLLVVAFLPALSTWIPLLAAGGDAAP